MLKTFGKCTINFKKVWNWNIQFKKRRFFTSQRNLFLVSSLSFQSSNYHLTRSSQRIYSLFVPHSDSISFLNSTLSSKRIFVTQSSKNPETSLLKEAFIGTLIGITKGIFGALVGLGGGVVAVPLLVSFANLTQHQAHGTTLPAILATGSVGAITYYTLGGGPSSVDMFASLILGGSALISAPFGARWAHSVSGPKLSLYMGIFMLLVVPLVILKSMFVSEEIETDEPQNETKKGLDWNWKTTISLLSIGTTAGLCSGAFGVGGGVIMVPFLSMMGSQQLALGTSLLAMLGPSLTGTLSHYHLGSIYFRILPFLILGSAIGSFCGTYFSVSLTEIQQREIFGACMALLAFRNFRNYYRFLKK